MEADGAAVVQAGNVSSSVCDGENEPTVSRCVTSAPRKGCRYKFWGEGRGGSREVGIKRKQVGGGSVGGIGVNASGSFCG